MGSLGGLSQSSLASTTLRIINLLSPYRASRSLSEGYPTAQHEKMLCDSWCIEVSLGAAQYRWAFETQA